MTAFVMLDRDGVINEDSPNYIKHPDEWLPIPGSLEAMGLLSQAGVDVYVATNQSGVARGLMDLPTLEAIHQKMRAAAAAAGGSIKAISYCPHHPDDNCPCRKPKPGMLLALAQEHGLDLASQPYVGDSLRDLQTAEAAGCLPVLVKTGNGLATLEQRPQQDQVYDDLLAFAGDFVQRIPKR